MPLKALRETFIKALWNRYSQATQTVQTLSSALLALNASLPPLDHFAVIDLPSAQSGIPVLRQLFERLEFEYRGCGYLADKHNGFEWLRSKKVSLELATNALPQVVIADFCLDELPHPVADIIKKYANQTKPFPFKQFDEHLHKFKQGETGETHHLLTMLLTYFSDRDWPMPTCAEIREIKAVNELLAWVLVFGRRPNHFTFAMHLSNSFSSFEKCLEWVEHEINIPLNKQGGRIKGLPKDGIQQASTQDVPQTLNLSDGVITLAAPFVEFVWRYPIVAHEPLLFSDYFSDFIPQNADMVVESLYDNRRINQKGLINV